MRAPRLEITDEGNVAIRVDSIDSTANEQPGISNRKRQRNGCFTSERPLDGNKASARRRERPVIANEIVNIATQATVLLGANGAAGERVLPQERLKRARQR